MQITCSCVPYLCVRVIATQGDCNEKEVGVKQVLKIGLERHLPSDQLKAKFAI